MTAHAAKMVLLILILTLSHGMASAETGKDLNEIKSVIEKSSLPRDKKTALYERASVALGAGIPSTDVAVIIKRGISRGANSAALEESLSAVVTAKEKGLPVRPVLDRIEQGLSKGVSSEKLSAVTKQLVVKLSAADGIVDKLRKSGMKGAEAEKGAAVHTVARALEKSIPDDPITKVGMKVVKQDSSLSRFDAAVDSMTFLVEMGMPVDQALRLINKAVDKGYSDKEMFQMEKEMSRMMRDGAKMEDAMKGMDSMMNSGNMGKGMSGGMSGGPGTGGSPPLHNTPGMGTHHGGGGPGMGTHKH